MTLRKLTIPTMTTAIKGRSGTKTNRWDSRLSQQRWQLAPQPYGRGIDLAFIYDDALFQVPRSSRSWRSYMS
jgi:hypothetical protein